MRVNYITKNQYLLVIKQKKKLKIGLNRSKNKLKNKINYKKNTTPKLTEEKTYI